MNVDECSFSKSLRTHYSWLPKGKGAPIINTNCKGNANVIFAFGCDGEWIWAIYNNSSTAERFSQFLMILKAYALFVLDRTEDELKIILDNATIHVATKTKRSAFYLELEVHWLPQYSLELAPVELVFGMAKRRLASIYWTERVDNSEEAGKKIIAKCFEALKRTMGTKIWIRFIKQSRSVIIRWWATLSLTKFIQGEDKDMKVSDIEEESKENEREESHSN